MLCLHNCRALEQARNDDGRTGGITKTGHVSHEAKKSTLFMGHDLPETSRQKLRVP